MQSGTDVGYSIGTGTAGEGISDSEDDTIPGASTSGDQSCVTACGPHAPSMTLGRAIPCYSVLVQGR